MRFVHLRLFPVLTLSALALAPSNAPAAEPARSKPPVTQTIGLGLETKPTDTDLTIMAVLPFSPAQRAGLRGGDRILQIDGKRTAGLALDELSKLLRGDEDGVVVITVETPGRPLRQVRLLRGPLIERPQDVQTLRDFIAREVRFAAKVGGLTSAEFDALLLDTELSVKSQGLRLSIEQRGFVHQFFLDVHGRKELRASYIDPPGQVVRKQMLPCLKTLSPAAWQKFDAECQLFAERRKEADVLAQIAAFDEALMLTTEQREMLRQLLLVRWTDVWRGHAVERAATDPVALCQTAVGAMDLFTIPDVELQAILRPSQVATFKLVQLPTREIAVFVDDGIPPVRRFVSRGLPVEEKRLRLKLWLERLVDDATAHADLDADQSQRLLAAGKLDLDTHFIRIAATEERAGDARVIAVGQNQIAGVRAAVPAIFAAEDSAFQRVLRKRLSAEQREQIAEADRDRGRFHRQAVLHLLTSGMAERALLTHKQAGRLQKLLTDEFARADEPENLAAWRQTTLEKLMRFQPETIETLLDDWQRPAVGEYLCELADAVDVPSTP